MPRKPHRQPRRQRQSWTAAHRPPRRRRGVSILKAASRFKFLLLRFSTTTDAMYIGKLDGA
eukprot:scaffold203541_cov18-Prasinocladus_malaysianus.AAC.1